MPKVTVLMSVYNGERYLREAVDSVLAQTFTDYEFVIVDDGSTDGTATILDNYADLHIVRLTNEHNIGLTESLNRGLSIAQGMYVARMDADDVSLPERFAKQVQFLDEHPDISVLGTGFQIIDDVGTRGVKVLFPTEPSLVKWQMFFYCPIVHPSVMVRRMVYERLGGYNPDVHHSEDYELWLRAPPETKFANLPDVLLQLRKHDQNKSIVNIHLDLQSVLIADQRALSAALGQQVSLDRVHALRDPRSITTARDMLDTAALVHQLYLVCTSNVSIPEKKQIRKDAANKLHKLATTCVRLNPAFSIIIWGWAIRLSPESLPRIIASTPMRTVRYLGRHLALRSD